MIFSRLRHPQTLAALAQLRSFGKGREGGGSGGARKHSPVCPQEHYESHTDSKKKRDRKTEEAKSPDFSIEIGCDMNIWTPKKLFSAEHT